MRLALLVMMLFLSACEINTDLSSVSNSSATVSATLDATTIDTTTIEGNSTSLDDTVNYDTICELFNVSLNTIGVEATLKSPGTTIPSDYLLVVAGAETIFDSGNTWIVNNADTITVHSYVEYKPLSDYIEAKLYYHDTLLCTEGVRDETLNTDINHSSS